MVDKMMDGALHTFPQFYAMAHDPQLKHIVIPTLRRYGGHEAVNDYLDLKKTMIGRGIDSERAQNTALYRASARADVREANKQLSSFVGVIGPTGKLSKRARRFWKKMGRATAAVTTMGASEIGYAIADDDVREKIKKAAGKGWSTFVDAVGNSLKAFTEVKDWHDVLDIVKVVLSAGASVAQDTIILGIQAAMMELIDPYMVKVSEAIGEGYAAVRGGARRSAQRLVEKMGGNKVVQKVIGEIVDTLFDLILGYPPCVLEKACIQPIAKALSKVEVPYVKAIGEALNIIWPIIQGEYWGVNMPQSSIALGLYAHGEVPLLPNAKLPDGMRKTLNVLMEAMDGETDWAIGGPESFGKYSPYLIDYVARGGKFKGPYVARTYGGTDLRASYYMKKPHKAQEVLESADRITGILKSVDKYLKIIAKYAEYGKQAYDLYKAVEGSDLSFDLDEWNAEDLGELLGDKVQDVQSWATTEFNSYADQAKNAAQNSDQIMSRMANRKMGQYQQIFDSATQKMESGKQFLGDAQDPTKRQDYFETIQNRGGDVATGTYSAAKTRAQQELDDTRDSVTGGINEARAEVNSVKSRIMGPIRIFSGLGGNLGKVSSAQAFMSEWMIAQIGLFARVHWNYMAQRWLESTPAERKRWKTNASAQKWKDEAIDYKAWYEKFSKSKNMQKMVVSYQAHKLPMANLSILLKVAQATGSNSALIIADVMDSRGILAGVKNLSKIDSGLPRKLSEQQIKDTVTKNAIPLKQVAQFANISKLARMGLKVNPAAVRAASMQEGLNQTARATKGTQPKWLVPVAIAGAAVTGAAIMTALTE